MLVVSLAGGLRRELFTGIPGAGSGSMEKVRLGLLGGHNNLKVIK